MPSIQPRKHALSAAVLFLAALPAVASWPGFRGSDGTGRAVEGLPPGDGPLTLELAWKRPLGSGYAGISVTGDVLVTAFTAGDRDVVAAFDAGSGEELWRYDLAPRYAGHDGSHDGPISTPAIVDGRVFALGPLGHLAALELVTGEVLWTAHLVDDHGAEAPFYGFGGSPLAVGETVVVQVGGEVGLAVGFDAASGELRWRALEEETMAASPVAAVVGGQTQVLVLGSRSLAGLDPADGSILWSLAHQGERGGMGNATSSPLPIGAGRFFVKHENPSSMVVSIGAASDSNPVVEASSRGMARSYSPPALGGDAVYGYTARFLSAVDPATGELLWRSREPGDGFVATVGDHLAVVTKTGALHLGPASREGWSETGRLQLFDDLAWTPPSYSRGAFYLRSLGEIARVDLVRGGASRVAEEALPERLAAIAEAENRGAAVDELLRDRELPLVDGEEVIFLWRGEAEDVAIAGDMIGMRREEPMNRLPGTDLWWWATELDRRARMSYLFYVDYEPTTDPSHGRRVQSTVLGADRNWNRGAGVEMSWFAMPDWPGFRELAAGGTEDAAGPLAKGRLESFEIEVERPGGENDESVETVPVPVQVWLPPGYQDSDPERRYPVAFVHDSSALTEGGWPEALERVVGSTVEPLIVVFPEIPRMRGGEGVFVESVVPAVDERYRTRRDPDSRANIGHGWGGFGVTEINFTHADQFGVLGLQSFYALDEQMAMAREAIGDATAETLPMRIYLEWGRWDLISPHEEMNMRASSRQAWDLFRERGWDPLGGEVWDSTDWASWRNRTGTMLEALFPAATEEAGGSLAAWVTGH